MSHQVRIGRLDTTQELRGGDPDPLLVSFASVVLGEVTVTAPVTRQDGAYVFDSTHLPFAPHLLTDATVDGHAVDSWDLDLGPASSTLTVRTT